MKMHEIVDNLLKYFYMFFIDNQSSKTLYFFELD